MEFQQLHPHHHSRNPMTRRAHSFKRSGANGGEVNLQINSPRSPRSPSESPGGSEAAEPLPDSPSADRWQHGQNLRSRFGVQFMEKREVKKPASGLLFRDKRKLGNCLFLVFCGVCFCVGVMRIFAGSWFGGILVETGEREQVWVL